MLYDTDFNNLFDILFFRTTTLTGFLLYWIPIICILSPSYLRPFGFVDGTQEFKVHRMQQFDLYGQAFGSRQAYLSSEVRIWSQPNIYRKTVLIHLNKITIERFRQLISNGINGLFILIPNMSSRWQDEQKQQLCELEQILLYESVQIPVYFLQETQQTIDLYRSIESRRDSQKDSAFAVLYDKVTADGYQFSIAQGQYHQRQDNVMYNIQGKLTGHGIEERLPKILFVAHYDASGIATGLSYGADSNASGLLVLLKLIRLFSKLYAKQTTRAKYNLLFLFSAGGKLNYQGSKRWIDDYHDQQQQQQLQNDINVVICLGTHCISLRLVLVPCFECLFIYLDALGQSNQLYMHVSKPPRDTQSAGILRDLLTRLSEKSVYGPLYFDQIHKKILKTSEFVAWEHEKYSWSKMPAFTISHLNTSKTCQHSTISDFKEDVHLSSIDKNFHYISDALIRLLYNTTDLNMSVIDHKYIMSQQQSTYDQQFLKIWLNFLTSRSRAQSLLTKQHPVLIALEQYAQNYLQNVQKVPVRSHSKKDPEFIFYDGDDEARLLYVYRVKPAIFDLVLASFIAIYLGIIYLYTFTPLKLTNEIDCIDDYSGQISPKAGILLM
ncbi:unnamed protein product [Didymodactylos carnosus]|uniref:Nicalin n=1 Tax=Didymodactylos carnosus TaxID=1234261 RepID=A0A813VMZ8_9BILA|nr:unnamed protein product [Didymodactylos carnosus]CAF0844007.1 unnamed protein product [Didymodactylos carnosus]CAF3512947.1 unnamed protein product [Didymodactylos carnosus]CAF3631420.1 unnamed protein product [Didymodactylos carnosus]